MYLVFFIPIILVDKHSERSKVEEKAHVEEPYKFTDVLKDLEEVNILWVFCSHSSQHNFSFLR